MINGASTHAKAKKATASARTVELPIAPKWQLPEGLEDVAVCAFDCLAESEEPTVFAIDRLAQPEDVVLLTGPPKVSYKTMLAVNLALARIAGGKWLGFDVVKERTRRVLIMSAETRCKVLVRRIRQQCEAQGLDPAVYTKFVHVIDQPVTLVPVDEAERVRAKAKLDAQLAAVKIHDETRRQQLQRGADAIADGRVAALGQNLDLLGAIMTADTWSLIVIDTLRQHMQGDENNSADAARFMAAARELARTCGCMVLIVHHSSKGGDQSDARSSRGSGEIIGAPDVLINIDASGKHPTAHFLCRNVESPPAVGYVFKVDGKSEAIRLEVLPPCSGKAGGIGGDDVLRVFEMRPNDGLTESKVRELVSKARGGKPGSKASGKTVKAQIAALLEQRLISECEIETRGARGFGKKSGATMPGYRLGTEGGRVPATRIDDSEMDGVGGADDC